MPVAGRHVQHRGNSCRRKPGWLQVRCAEAKARPASQVCQETEGGLMGTPDTREKGTLKVRCEQSAAADPVQIEVRKPNLTLVGVTSPSQPIEVPVGKYHVRGISSTGLELSGEVDVVGGQLTELWLQPETSEIAFAPPAVKSSASVRARSTRPSAEFESFEIATDPAGVRTFTGNVLLGQAVESSVPAAHENPDAGPNRHLFSIDPGHLCAIQVRNGGTPSSISCPRFRRAGDAPSTFDGPRRASPASSASATTPVSS